MKIIIEKKFKKLGLLKERKKERKKEKIDINEWERMKTFKA